MDACRPKGSPSQPSRSLSFPAALPRAKAPADEKPAEDARHHWAFQVPRGPAPRTASAGSNPIDAFLAEGQHRRGLSPLAEADKPTLLRRVYWDLTGLPPTVAQLRDFLDDGAPTPGSASSTGCWPTRITVSAGAATGWTSGDSDWYGLGEQVRNAQKHMWHWRDWIVESLNEAKGYDRMVEEMLAADEIAPLDAGGAGPRGFSYEITICSTGRPGSIPRSNIPRRRFSVSR